jgi:peptide deformylase
LVTANSAKISLQNDQQMSQQSIAITVAANNIGQKVMIFYMCYNAAKAKKYWR